MRRVKTIIKSFMVAMVGIVSIASPMAAYAYGCNYSNNVTDPLNGYTVTAQHRCEVYSDDVWMRTTTSGRCSVKENIYLRGKFGGEWYDGGKIGYMGYEEVNGTVSAWASSYFGKSLAEVERAKPEFGICRSGKWSWIEGFYQAAN